MERLPKKWKHCALTTYLNFAGISSATRNQCRKLLYRFHCTVNWWVSLILIARHRHALATRISVAWKCSVKLSYGACKKLVKFAATLFDAGYIVPGTGIDFYYFALFDE